MSTTAAQFNTEIKAKIPIIGLMGCDVTVFNPTEVRLNVKYLPNKNHVNSVFGGSLYASAALACYGLFRAMAESSGFTEEFLVIQEGNIRYKKPVTKDFEVVASRAPHLDLPQFIETVKKARKGRLPLEARIIQDGETCATFTGVYVLRMP